MAEPPIPPQTNKVNVSLDLRFIIIGLLVVILGMLLIWRPWSGAGAAKSERTISVSGQASLNAVPDEFVFNPSYEFKDADKATALAELNKQSDELVAKLKSLGVADSKIKTDSSGYNYDYYYDNSAKTYDYTLGVTVTLDNKDLAQKVQDYLLTTDPTGSVSPQATFSHAKQKVLENQARDAATKDARAKAEQSAKNLGFDIGKVKSVDDSGFGGRAITPLIANGSNFSTSDKATSSLAVQPGENNLDYTVTVVYYVK